MRPAILVRIALGAGVLALLLPWFGVDKGWADWPLGKIGRAHV